MSKLIIGIHGLANKPKKEELEDWWKKSIAEGLKKNCRYNKDFEFSMVYWAGQLHLNHQHREKDYYFDDLYNDEPYYEAEPGALKDYDEGLLDMMITGALDVIGDILDRVGKSTAVSNLTDRIMDKVVRDLAFYYDKKQKIAKPGKGTAVARDVLISILQNALRKHSNDEIMLIAHSMGTIISYDTLRDIGQSKDATDQKIRVPYFVTIGSPLGIPLVMRKIKSQRIYDKKDRLRTPTIVTKSWINFADRRDVVAVDAKLADDYKSNPSSVSVKDDLVHTDYVRPEGKKSPNPHKSYGYLRTPEVSKHIRAFLEA